VKPKHTSCTDKNDCKQRQQLCDDNGCSFFHVITSFSTLFKNGKVINDWMNIAAPTAEFHMTRFNRMTKIEINFNKKKYFFGILACFSILDGAKAAIVMNETIVMINRILSLIGTITDKEMVAIETKLHKDDELKWNPPEKNRNVMKNKADKIQFQRFPLKRPTIKISSNTIELLMIPSSANFITAMLAVCSGLCFLI
jgi:hypothetical protein